METIVHQESLREFFSTQFDEAISSNSLELNDMTKHYLLDLLTEFTDADSAFFLEREHHGEPLSILLLKASSKRCGEKVRDNKMIGDSCLFFSGFFPDYVQGKTVEPAYFITLGSRAYSNVASALRGTKRGGGDSFRLLFGELSIKFSEVVDICMEMSDRMIRRTNRDLIRIYERYLHCRSERYEKILKDAGIAPIPLVNTRH